MIIYRCWHKYCSRYGQRTNSGRCEGTCSLNREQRKGVSQKDYA